MVKFTLPRQKLRQTAFRYITLTNKTYRSQIVICMWNMEHKAILPWASSEVMSFRLWKTLEESSMGKGSEYYKKLKPRENISC